MLLAKFMITARTQVKDILRKEGINNVANDYMDRLDEKVEQLVKDSARRAKENSRRTVMGRDV